MGAYGYIWIMGAYGGKEKEEGRGSVKTGFEGPPPATLVECTRMRSCDIFSLRSYPGTFLDGNEGGWAGVEAGRRSGR